MLGSHCIKTWSTYQNAFALSSAEAELYAMVEGVSRGKGLQTLGMEMGFADLQNAIGLGTDSSAARSFVNRRGLGRMRHLQLRDLWLQKEIRDGNLLVDKVAGVNNPADLMTKVLRVGEIIERLRRMNIDSKWRH